VLCEGGEEIGEDGVKRTRNSFRIITVILMEDLFGQLNPRRARWAGM
jgi:hypothetical protein